MVEEEKIFDCRVLAEIKTEKIYSVNRHALLYIIILCIDLSFYCYFHYNRFSYAFRQWRCQRFSTTLAQVPSVSAVYPSNNKNFSCTFILFTFRALLLYIIIWHNTGISRISCNLSRKQCDFSSNIITFNRFNNILYYSLLLAVDLPSRIPSLRVRFKCPSKYSNGSVFIHVFLLYI